jgi:hypothetical protein
MALMDLLTAGRSLSEARERPHRYKVRHGALPKFGKPESALAEKKLESSVAGQFEGTEETVEAQPMNTNMVAVETRREPTLERWAQKVNPFKSVRPSPPRPVVQGELSLDRVKPVRNDLSDSDLELVAVMKRPDPLPSCAKSESAKEAVVKAMPMWTRMRGLFQRAR